MDKKVKVYGERNCGTNYLIKLLHQNFHCNLIRGVVPKVAKWKSSEDSKDEFFNSHFQDTLGWKHGRIQLSKLLPIIEQGDVYFITISKNPFAFLWSLYQRPYHMIGEKPVDFKSFLTSPWYLRKRDNIDKSYCENPIELWNLKNKSYLELKEKYDCNSVQIRYESLLLNSLDVLSKITSKLGLEKKRNDFSNIENSTKDSTLQFSDYQSYYLKKEYLNNYSEDDYNFVLKYLDKDILSGIGYTN